MLVMVRVVLELVGVQFVGVQKKETLLGKTESEKFPFTLYVSEVTLFRESYVYAIVALVFPRERMFPLLS